MEMEQLERIGVSLDKELLLTFDKLIAKQGYQSRSEAIRDLIRQQLSQACLKDPKAKAVAAVFMVYDHHATKLSDKLIDLQHYVTAKRGPSHTLQVISSLHVHLDEHDCLEVVVLRGQVRAINRMAENILSLKGVKLGRINLLSPAPATSGRAN